MLYIMSTIYDYNIAMQISILTLGQLQTNCYIVFDKTTKEGIVIDPSDSAEYIAEKVNELDLVINSIIATHGHFDHNLASGELQMILQVPYYIHKAEWKDVRGRLRHIQRFFGRLYSLIYGDISVNCGDNPAFVEYPSYSEGA